MCDETIKKACAAIIIANFAVEERKNRKRKMWSKEWLQIRNKFSHMQLIHELKLSSRDYENYLRMTNTEFNILLQKVTPYIKKNNTLMRDAISVEERLSITLRFLATGRSYEDLKFTAIISPQALGKIIPETCEAIYKSLKADFIKFPQLEEDWLQIEKDFLEMWNFPHCVGAIDGKHIRIAPPAGSGSYYYNYKGFHSIVLMACVDANYKFFMVDIGCNGRVSDGGVIEQTKFYKKLINKELNLPCEEILPRSTNQNQIPRVFLCDDAFALTANVMKPFANRTLTRDEKIFNYRLSRGRRVVENAFGILATRFRIFHSTILLDPKKVEKIVMACCVLHNFLRENNRSAYSPPHLIDFENVESGTITHGEWRKNSQQLTNLSVDNSSNASADAKNIRDSLKNYFINEGKVLFQDRMII